MTHLKIDVLTLFPEFFESPFSVSMMKRALDNGTLELDLHQIRDFGLGKSSFNQELGLAYVGEKYRHAEADDYATFRYAHHYKWDVAAVDGLAFVHNFEFLPQVDDWSGNYIIDTDAGITYAFRANWQLIAKVEWDYKKKVGPATKHSDLRYFLGLGYKW